MKKTAIVLIITGMFSWAVYQFIYALDEKSIQEEANTTMQQAASDIEGIGESNEIGIQRGELALDFELTTLDGEKVKLSDYKGQRVMLNFWATWCPPCRDEMPDMQKLQENHDIQILAVNLTETESDPAKVQEFMDELNLTFTVPMDEKSVVSNDYQIIAYPTSYMIDSDGRIQFVTMGQMSFDLMVEQFEEMQ